MLALTKKTEYALIALTYLCRHGQKVCSAREIADTCHVPLPLLMNILKTLNQHNLIASLRGAKGGYQASRSADDITIHSVIQALEGPVKMVQCVTDDHQPTHHDNRCELIGCCTIRSPLLKIQEKLETLLAGTTIAELMNHTFQASATTTEERIHEVHLSR